MNKEEVVCGSKWLAASNLVLEVTCVREAYICYDILGMNCSGSAETEFFLKQCKPVDDDFIRLLEKDLNIDFK